MDNFMKIGFVLTLLWWNINSFHRYEQSDGSRRQEKGELRNAGAENEFVAVSGSYSFLAPDGIIYSVNYTADENGFHPTVGTGPTGLLPPVIVHLLGIKTYKK